VGGTLLRERSKLVESHWSNQWLTSDIQLGRTACEFWKQPKKANIETDSNSDDQKRQQPSRIDKLRAERLEKSNQFLELYKQGLSYQQIGDRFSISRERVRQVLKPNPEFHEYLKQKEEEKAALEQEQKEKAKEELYSRSLAAMYPERVAELWDYEKNGDLKPEEVLAGTTMQSVWFECPIDGHSWRKKPNDITTSWTRSGTSGCPKCAGKTKKRKVQPPLAETYPELVRQYWDYTKNSELGLDPEKLSLGSNKKAWFKCPIDGNEWQASIASTVNQQWSKGNAGCRICNGTAERKKGKWRKRESIAVEFPEEVEKYWLFETNNELGIDPRKLTSGSQKEAFFKCPDDGYEWITKLASIKTSWRKGNSGCPKCAGRLGSYQKQLSLLETYPDFVSKYWDYEKNSNLGLDPNKISCGSSKSAWFKCPEDDYSNPI